MGCVAVSTRDEFTFGLVVITQGEFLWDVAVNKRDEFAKTKRVLIIRYSVGLVSVKQHLTSPKIL